MLYLSRTEEAQADKADPVRPELPAYAIGYPALSQIPAICHVCRQENPFGRNRNCKSLLATKSGTAEKMPSYPNVEKKLKVKVGGS